MKKLLIAAFSLSAFVATSALACDGNKDQTAENQSKAPAVAKAKKTETKAKKEDAVLASAGKK